MASLFIGHAAQKSKLHNLQYDEGGNHMAEAEAEAETMVILMWLICSIKINISMLLALVFSHLAYDMGDHLKESLDISIHKHDKSTN